LGNFKLEQVGDGSRRQFVGDINVEGEKRAVSGEGNGPLSSALSALQNFINGVLTIREYSEHSVGEGADVVAASYVELTYEKPGAKKTRAWGVATDTDITASGIKAVMTAASNLKVAMK